MLRGDGFERLISGVPCAWGWCRGSQARGQEAEGATEELFPLMGREARAGESGLFLHPARVPVRTTPVFTSP